MENNVIKAEFNKNSFLDKKVVTINRNFTGGELVLALILTKEIMDYIEKNYKKYNLFLFKNKNFKIFNVNEGECTLESKPTHENDDLFLYSRFFEITYSANCYLENNILIYFTETKRLIQDTKKGFSITCPKASRNVFIKSNVKFKYE